MATQVLSVPRTDPTPYAAIARAEGREPYRRLEVSLLDRALAKYDEWPTVARAAVLAMVERTTRHFA